MLKVWRGKSAIFAECTACGSYGTANHLQPKIKMEPEIEAALERHTAHMMALRSHFQNAAGAISTQIRNGSMSRNDGGQRVKELWLNHVAQVRLGEASLPSPDGKVKELVSACPWCNTVSDEIEIEALPDDVAEPAFSLAKKIVPKSFAAVEGK
jgi:hypothetical protein